MALQRTGKTAAVEPGNPWTHALRVTAPALALAPTSFIADLRTGFAAQGLSGAVLAHNTGAIYDWLMRHVGLQGISDAAAYRYTAQHGNATWEAVQSGLASEPSCPRLNSYWAFERCFYRKAAQTCSEPRHRPCCPLPALPLRKGSLNVAAFGIALFIRDTCGGDLVGWIDRRLADADPGPDALDRGLRLRDAVLGPLQGIGGVGPKVLQMLLADLLIAADPDRERWVTAGSWMVAVDSLVHAFLHRTGVLSRFSAEHAYGPACVVPGGCRVIIEGLAQRIDACAFNPDFRVVFPRFVQAAIWAFCAEGAWNICNGNRIDDRSWCQQATCPAYVTCDRVSLRPL